MRSESEIISEERLYTNKESVEKIQTTYTYMPYFLQILTALKIITLKR